MVRASVSPRQPQELLAVQSPGSCVYRAPPLPAELPATESKGHLRNSSSRGWRVGPPHTTGSRGGHMGAQSNSHGSHQTRGAERFQNIEGRLSVAGSRWDATLTAMELSALLTGSHSACNNTATWLLLSPPPFGKGGGRERDRQRQ